MSHFLFVDDDIASVLGGFSWLNERGRLAKLKTLQTLNNLRREFIKRVRPNERTAAVDISCRNFLNADDEEKFSMKNMGRTTSPFLFSLKLLAGGKMRNFVVQSHTTNLLKEIFLSSCIFHHLSKVENSPDAK